MRRLFLTVLLFVLTPAVPAFSQQRWERNYGGTGGDYGSSVQQTQVGGYIVAGYTYSFGYGGQVYFVKTNASGDTLWTRNYGGASNEYGWSVQQTTDEGYVVAGSTNSFGNSGQVYLLKINATGDILWTRNYGGTGDDGGRSVQQTQDTGYVVAGWFTSSGNGGQVYLVKTNALGDTLWTRTYGGADYDGGNAAQQTQDGGYIVAGWTSSFGNLSQVYLIKTNATGDTLWTKTYGGASFDYGESVQQTSDGGYIVAGYTDSFGDSDQVYLIKTNGSGDTLWTRTYGGVNDDRGYSVQQTSDGSYIVGGWTNSFGNFVQVYLIKTNAGGDTLWTRTYGGTGDDYCNSVQQTVDGGYIVAGYTSSFGNGNQVYLIKTDAEGNSGVEMQGGRLDGSTVRQLKATPNPFTSFAQIPGHSSEIFALYDVSGRRVGTYKGDRIGEGLQAGVYFVRTLEGKAGMARIVKIR